jgi:hypothetical protein
MTYNFDPDRWLEAHRRVLEACRERGEISDAELEAELLELDRRFDEMVARLDGTFEIPTRRSDPEE